MTCRICKGGDFKDVLDMGMNPLVNSLIEQKDLSTPEDEFPLVVRQCQGCSLVQLTEVVDSHHIYRDQDYLYFSGDMPGLSDYFKEYAEFIEAVFLSTAKDLVVEIGSNDGTMLKHFKGYRILGVDPSSNVVVRALAHKIPTLSEFFSHRIAKSIVRDFGKAKMIYGNNCIAHIDNLDDIMNGVVELLTNDGVFGVECNYWGGMVTNKNYSLIYHDHFSYFTLMNWVDYAKKFRLRVFDAVITPAQGGSLRLFMDRGERKITDRCEKLASQEIETHLADYETCVAYEKNVRAEAQKLHNLIRDLRVQQKTIAGYGAAAKGFSVLKLADLGQADIEYFVDDSPAKQGKFTPITHIPVISRKEAEDKLPDYFFLTAPNYEKVIIEKESDFQANGGKFITVDSRII